MVLNIKRVITSQLTKVFNKQINHNLMKIKLIKNDNKNYLKPIFCINLNDLNDNKHNEFDVKNSVSKKIQQNLSFIKNIFIELNAENRPQLMFEIEENFLFKQLINDLKSNQMENYGKSRLSCNGSECETILVEFSSPNIAKPFHVGNLRSTIIGNFVANMNRFCGHNVIAVNYLGDWGTQFGVLSLAYDYFGDDKTLATNALKHLFDVYVKGNNECNNSEEWRERAKQRFTLLESKQNSHVLKQWQTFRELSIHELKALYSRLGISFDEFHSESMYSKASLEVVQQLRQLNIIEDCDESAAAFARIQNSDKDFLKIPIIKKDGSTLYLTRDIAAAIHRKELYNFSKMYYVVDSSQSKHFNNLINIFKEAKNHIYHDLIHLRFGRIIGMSTRKGDIIFLEDVLNEAKERAIESIKSSPTTKISDDLIESVADILGMSGILIHDMSNRRVKEYKFNWDLALKHTGNTGIALQYTHARLCNLEINCGIPLNLDSEPHYEAVNSFEGNLLINVLSQFDDILLDTYERLEPCILVDYLFKLKNAINRANQELTIKGQSLPVAESRLLLFYCARNALNQGMKLLGLNPLKSM